MTRTLHSVLRFLFIPVLLTTYFSASALICKNGVFVSLDASGQVTVPAEQFVLYNNTCCSSGISYEILAGSTSTYQPNASFNCDDLGQQPVRIKFNDCLGVAAYCETFVVVQGNLGVCDTGCGNCCLPNVVFRPLFLALYDNFTTEIHASWFNDGSFSNCAPGPLWYSFSQNTADSIMTLNCDFLGQFPVALWATDAAGNQSFGEPFTILPTPIGDCIGTGSCLPAPVAFNGVVLPLGLDGKAYLHARDFDAGSYVSPCSGAASYTVSFSSNPNDTLLYLTCNEIGQQPIQFYVRDNQGNINYSETYVIVEDLYDYCTTPPNLVPPNDDACNAYDINYLLNTECTEYFFNIGADAGTNEVTPPLAACGIPNTWCDAAAVAEKTVWFKFEAPSAEKITVVTEGMNTQLALWESASCGVLKAGFATLIAANDDDPSVPNGGSKLEAACLEAGKTYFLQMDGFGNSEGSFGLKFSSTGPACSDATAEKTPLSTYFSIYPNPASSFVDILANQEEIWRNGKILISDVSSKRLIQEELACKQQRIDICHLPSGIYFVQLQTRNGITKAQKLVILR